MNRVKVMNNGTLYDKLLYYADRARRENEQGLYEEEDATLAQICEVYKDLAVNVSLKLQSIHA